MGCKMKEYIMNNLLIQPKHLETKPGVCAFENFGSAYTNLSGYDLHFLVELSGHKIPVVQKIYDTAQDMYVLVFGKEQCARYAHNWTNDEEYLMDITPNQIVIAGKTPEGLIQGLKALLRLVAVFTPIPCMYIEDYPDIPFRSVHVCMFRPDDGTKKEESSPEYIKKMIKMAAICGYNHIFLEFWGMFPYSLPYAHWPNAYTKEEIADLVSYAMDKLYIRPLPAQNLTTHAGWSRITTRQHVVLDQAPEMADMYIPGGWCFATENPKTKAFLETVMDELIALFRNPPYLHACCDKAFGFGSTEEDRTVSADILYAKHISFLNNHLQKKGVRMIMWSDMLYSSMDALYFKCNEKISDFLPKNILMNIWTHNDPGKSWYDADFFEDKGFETVYSPFINEQSIENMIDLCHRRKSYGMVQTTWYCPQTAVPYVVLSGALQWCGKKPAKEQICQFGGDWYRA